MRHARQRSRGLHPSATLRKPQPWQAARGQRRANLPRLCLREHRKRFNARLIIRDPVHHSVPVLPEFLGSHVERFFFGQVPRHSFFSCLPENLQWLVMLLHSSKVNARLVIERHASVVGTVLIEDAAAIPCNIGSCFGCPGPAHTRTKAAVPQALHNRTPAASRTPFAEMGPDRRIHSPRLWCARAARPHSPCQRSAAIAHMPAEKVL